MYLAISFTWQWSGPVVAGCVCDATACISLSDSPHTVSTQTAEVGEDQGLPSHGGGTDTEPGETQATRSEE